MDGEESATTIPTLEVGEDDFASTRPPDDIFDLEPISPPKPPTGPRAGNERSRRGDRGDRGGRRGRGGGRGNRGENRGGAPRNQNNRPPATTREEDEGAEPVQTVVEESPERGPPADQAGENGGGAEGPPRRGKPERRPYPTSDRSATGGLRKPKLTEDQLTERINAIKLKDKAREERLNAAAKDQAQFDEAEEARKKADAQRKSEDRKKKMESDKNRRALDAEREQNRQRKLKALSNREWDSAKNEEDFKPENASGYNPRFRRGAHGAVSGTIWSPPGGSSQEAEGGAGEEEVVEEASGEATHHGRGRGGRGRGGRGRGDRGERGERRGRGGRGGGGGGGGNQIAQSLNAKLASEADFPSLPASRTKPEAIAVPEANAAKQDPIAKAFDAMSPVGNWAEEATAHADD